LLCGLTSDLLGSQRGFRCLAGVDLMIDRLARGTYCVSSLTENGGDLEVSLAPLLELSAGTRRLVCDLFELGNSLLSAGEPLAQLGLG
jgi:hypothetical protein